MQNALFIYVLVNVKLCGAIAVSVQPLQPTAKKLKFEKRFGCSFISGYETVPVNSTTYSAHAI